MVNITGIVLGILVFSATILALGLAVGNMEQTYNVPTDVGFNNTYNKLDEISDLTTSLQGNLTGQAIETQGFFETVTTGAFKVVRLIFGMVGFTNDVVQEASVGAASKIGLPTWIPTVIIVMLVIVITFIIIGALMRSDRI